jgi:hypothetical protein
MKPSKDRRGLRKAKGRATARHILSIVQYFLFIKRTCREKEARPAVAFLSGGGVRMRGRRTASRPIRYRAKLNLRRVAYVEVRLSRQSSLVKVTSGVIGEGE